MKIHFLLVKDLLKAGAVKARTGSMERLFARWVRFPHVSQAPLTIVTR